MGHAAGADGRRACRLVRGAPASSTGLLLAARTGPSGRCLFGDVPGGVATPRRRPRRARHVAVPVRHRQQGARQPVSLAAATLAARGEASRARCGRRGRPGVVVVQSAGDRQVVAAIRRLKPVDREIVMLSAWEELPRSVIAEMMGMTKAAVDQRIHRSYERLARMLGVVRRCPTRPPRRLDRHRYEPRTDRTDGACGEPGPRRGDPRRRTHTRPGAARGQCSGPSTASRSVTSTSARRTRRRRMIWPASGIRVGDGCWWPQPRSPCSGSGCRGEVVQDPNSVRTDTVPPHRHRRPTRQRRRRCPARPSCRQGRSWASGCRPTRTVRPRP